MVRTLCCWIAVGLLVMPLSVQAKDKGKDKSGFRITSPDVVANTKMSLKHVYKGFGCDGGNLSPALMWTGAPPETKSFAITAYDPDAPTGSGWWHWVVYNIPAETTELKTGAGSSENPQLPPGALQGRTDFGTSGYGGPCPPQGHGTHHYHFTVHALKVEKLEVPADATAALIGYMINANRIGKATLTGLYSR